MTPPTAGTLTPHAQPEPGPRHFLSLPHAQTVPTPTLDAVHRALEQTLAEQAAMCLYGDAGCGKTFAVQSVLDKTSVSRPGLLGGVRICHLSPRPAPTPTALRAELLSHVGMGITGSPTRDPGVLDATLRTHLAAHQHLLVVDEAGRLTTGCVEYLCYLLDDPATQLALVLIADPGGIRMLRRQPLLASRIAVLLQVLPLTPDEVRWAIPQPTPVARRRRARSRLARCPPLPRQLPPLDPDHPSRPAPSTPRLTTDNRHAAPAARRLPPAARRPPMTSTNPPTPPSVTLITDVDRRRHRAPRGPGLLRSARRHITVDPTRTPPEPHTCPG
ncbi:ATP-binding protein, partial [Streptomyces sp. T1317-0309]